MTIVGGVDIHRKQLTFDCLDTVSGQVQRGQVASADRDHLRAWLARFAGRGDVAFAMEGCTGVRLGDRRGREGPGVRAPRRRGLREPALRPTGPAGSKKRTSPS